MAEESSNVEVSDRGLFGSGKKDEAKNEEDVLVTGVENPEVEETPVEKKEEEKKESLGSSFNSSSDEEEVGPDGEIKKKTLKEKIKEKFGEEKKEETAPAPEPNPVAVAPVAPSHLKEKVEEDETDPEPNPVAVAPVAPAHLKEELEEYKKKEPAPAVAPNPVAAAPVAPAHLVEPDNYNVVMDKTEEDVKAKPEKGEEKEGFFDKIMDKIPGIGDKKETAPAPTPVPVSTSPEEVRK